MVAKLNNPNYWIGIPISLIIVVNLFLFYSYTIAQPNLSEEFSGGENALFWGYIQSETFQGITAGLVFPIFLFLFEQRFKILEKRENDRLEKEKEREITRKNHQWDCIEELREIWAKLFSQSIKISYILELEKENLHELNLQINEQFGKILHVTNVCKFRFDNIDEDEIEMIGDFMHLQMKMNLSVLQYLIEEKHEKDERKKAELKKENYKIQASLGIICKEAFHYVVPKVLSVLKDSIDLEYEFLSKEKRKAAEIDKKKQINDLRELYNENYAFEYHYSELLDCLDENELNDKFVQLYKDEAKKYEKTIRENNPDDPKWKATHFYSDYESSKELTQPFYQIDPMIYSTAEKRRFSRKYLNMYAACFAEDLLRTRIANRAKTKVEFGNVMDKKYFQI